MQSPNQDDHPPCLSCLWASLFTVAVRTRGTAGPNPAGCFSNQLSGTESPTKKLCVCVCLSVCAAMCLSNPHLPRQFQDHHSDRFNDQWQSGLQLRAGISVLSQPIRAEMLGNWKGQAEPYESACAHTYTHTHTHTHTHRPTKLSHIYIYYNWHSQNTHIHITFFFVSENQGAGDSTAHLCRFLLPWKNKDRAQQEIKLIEQPFWLGSKREGSMCFSTEIKCDDQSPAGLTLPQGSSSP